MGHAYRHQDTRAEGAEVVVVHRGGAVERHVCATAKEAAERAAAIVEILSWIGTPFADCGFVKGPGGAVDCAMTLVGTYRVTGIIGDFDPRPYPPRWFQHRNEERFLDCLTLLGAHEIACGQAKPGDVLVWRFGRTYAHGAVLINSLEVCHAYAAAKGVVVSALDEPLLSTITWRGQNIDRPMRAFTLWPPAPKDPLKQAEGR
jgi:cell wall-associated NlpC family hydrolase